MAQLNFDSTNVKPAEAVEAIPAGWYVAHMVASEMKPTSKADGAFLSCEFQILEGEYAGRKQYDRLNLQNSNQTAMEIAYRTLSAICHATGVIQVQDSSQLHNRPLQIKVSVRAAGIGADGKQYETTNEIKGYRANTQQIAPAQPSFSPPVPQPAQPQQPAQPAWAPQPTQPPMQPVQQPAWAPQQPPQQMQMQPQQAQPQMQQPPAAQQPAQQMPAWANASPVQPQQQPQQQAHPAQQAQPAQQAAPIPPWVNQQQAS